MSEPTTPTRAEERETVSYTLPRRLVKAVALHAVEADLKSRSHAAEDLIARGLETVESETQDRVPA